MAVIAMVATLAVGEYMASLIIALMLTHVVRNLRGDRESPGRLEVADSAVSVRARVPRRSNPVAVPKASPTAIIDDTTDPPALILHGSTAETRRPAMESSVTLMTSGREPPAQG